MQEQYLHIAFLVTCMEVFGDLGVIGAVLYILQMFAESVRQCHPRLPHADHIATGSKDTIDGVLRLAGFPANKYARH